MLVPNLRPKVVPHDGSRLLLGLIVRARGRLVARAPSPVSAQQARPSGPAVRIGSPHPRHPLPMAPLPQRKGLLALRLFAPAPLFPHVVHPRPTQGRRIRTLHPELRLLQLAFAEDLAQPSAVYRVMDTTLVPAMVRVRASGKGLFCAQASFGRSASKTEWVYGFKAAVVVDPNGVVTAFGLAPAASEERPIGEALVAEDHYDAYLADKGFTGVEWERRWMEIYGALVAATPKDDSRRAWSEADQPWASGKRQIIEGVIYQLKDFFSLERHRAKTLGGLLRRLAAKIAAYTCAQRINDSLGRPLRHLADLLV
jgi:hypothetical protein